MPEASWWATLESAALAVLMAFVARVFGASQPGPKRRRLRAMVRQPFRDGYGSTPRTEATTDAARRRELPLAEPEPADIRPKPLENMPRIIPDGGSDGPLSPAEAAIRQSVTLRSRSAIPHYLYLVGTAWIALCLITGRARRRTLRARRARRLKRVS
jgi:hypothetical protein